MNTVYILAWLAENYRKKIYKFKYKGNGKFFIIVVSSQVHCIFMWHHESHNNLIPLEFEISVNMQILSHFGINQVD